VCLYVIIILLHDLTLLRCKTCAIDIGSLKATYLLTYLLTFTYISKVENWLLQRNLTKWRFKWFLNLMLT